MSETRDSDTRDLADRKDPDSIQEDKLYPRVVTCTSNHIFERISGTEAKCRNCPLGYFLSPETEVKEGHIYLHGERLI